MKNRTELLRLIGLPVFEGVEGLASLCHISSDVLLPMVSNSYPFYRRVIVSKPGGGARLIHQPNKPVRAIQAWILRTILEKLSPSPYATAFSRGASTKKNVLPHNKNRHFLMMDLLDFFPSIKRPRVFALFESVGYSRGSANILSRLCTCGSVLPQGGITSPAISNLVTNRLDRRLAGLCNKKNITYTRYADDMTFSSNNISVLTKAQGLIRQIIEDEGFRVNPNKTRITGPAIHCRVTGLVKDSSSPHFGIGKKRKNQMRHVMFNLAINGRVVDDRYKCRASIEGWLNYLRYVDEPSYQYMRRYWDRISNLS